MEFNEKLQELRKQKGLTQEELSEILYVSRTAISKWESGRGYPNIESLKAIAKYFCITVDELLSGDELLRVAEQEGRRKENRLRDWVFALLDVGIAIFFFLPFFSQKVDGKTSAVSLLGLTEKETYLKVAYFTVVIANVVFGVLQLVFVNCQNGFWIKHKRKLSLAINGLAILLFGVSLQAYATVLAFVFLAIKVLLFVKV